MYRSLYIPISLLVQGAVHQLWSFSKEKRSFDEKNHMLCECLKYLGPVISPMFEDNCVVNSRYTDYTNIITIANSRKKRKNRKRGISRRIQEKIVCVSAKTEKTEKNASVELHTQNRIVSELCELYVFFKKYKKLLHLPLDPVRITPVAGEKHRNDIEDKGVESLYTDF